MLHVIEMAKLDFAKKRGMAADSIILKEAQAVDWPDASLGLPKPGCTYAQMITPGYRLILSDGIVDCEYHTDENSSIVCCMLT